MISLRLVALMRLTKVRLTRVRLTVVVIARMVAMDDVGGRCGMMSSHRLHSRPLGREPPDQQGRETADERSPDASHGNVRGGLALPGTPEAGEDFNREPAQGQQPGDHQQAAERCSK
jgi:hypothetical protein